MTEHQDLPRTAVEKIMARAAGRARVHAGDEVVVRPDRILAYNFPGYVDTLITTMEQEFGVTELEDPGQYVVFIDHLDTRGTPQEAALHDVTREWAARQGVRLYEDAGIGHQAAAELGFAMPGSLVVHFDPHISSLGAFGCLGLGLNRAILDPWVSGRVELIVPPTVRLRLEGALRAGVDGRDLVHHLIAQYGADGFLDAVVEFTGPGLGALSIGERQAIGGMIVFTGALSALFDVDEEVTAYLADAGYPPYEVVRSDPGAEVRAEHRVDLSSVRPMIVRPGSARASHTTTVEELAGTRVTRGYIGSCASGRIEDIRKAAAVLDGGHVADGFELLVVPTSTRIRAQADEEGLIRVLEAAGAVVGKSSCDFCFGYAAPASASDVVISSGTLNIRGRLGSAGAGIYLASAETVATAALHGRVTIPEGAVRA